MAYPGNCDVKTNEANAEECRKTGRYYGAALVTIDETRNNGSSWTIAFSATNTDRVLTRFTGITWGDQATMWASCPSSLPSKATATDAGDPPPIGTRGYLYLEKDFLAKNRILAGTPKWPDSLGAPEPFYNTIEIWPSSLILKGAELSDSDRTVGSVDLLDPTLAAPNQQLTTNGEPISVRLTQNGLKKFGLTFLPWALLPEAVKVIEGARKDAHALAAAWQVVAIAVDRLSADRAARLAKDDDIALLRKVWPSL